MDFFAINPANGILAINSDALHGDLVLAVTSLQQSSAVQNGDLPLPPPKHLVVASITSLTNGGLPQVPQSLDFTNGDLPLPPPQK